MRAFPGAPFVISLPLLCLSAGVAAGEPLTKKSLSLEDARKAGACAAAPEAKWECGAGGEGDPRPSFFADPPVRFPASILPPGPLSENRHFPEKPTKS